MFHSIPSPELNRINYVGRDLFTADNHWIGIVREMREHPRDGSIVLIVYSDHPDQRPVCVKASEIGVVTRTRVMLDVMRNLFDRELDTRYRCPPEMLTA